MRRSVVMLQFEKNIGNSQITQSIMAIKLCISGYIASYSIFMAIQLNCYIAMYMSGSNNHNFLAIWFGHITFLAEARLPNRLWQYMQSTLTCQYKVQNYIQLTHHLYRCQTSRRVARTDPFAPCSDHSSSLFSWL